MKHLFTKYGLVAMLLLAACAKDAQQQPPAETIQYRYSTPQGFRDNITQVIQSIAGLGVTAWLDTLPDGTPDATGRQIPLAQWATGHILQPLQAGGIETAVYETFHFNEATFSLISYLKKSEMMGQISPQTLAALAAQIPLPPAPAAGFTPPVAGGGAIKAGCDCEPEIRIKATWAYKPACGNYTKNYTGYAANNTLNNMPRGILYRFDPEVVNCDCDGVFTTAVTAPAGAAYGYAKGANGSVNFIGESSGAYTITFTYTCPCGKIIVKSFTITIA